MVLGSFAEIIEPVLSKAAVILTRGAYSQYVSTAKGRERRWRLFSTFPDEIFSPRYTGHCSSRQAMSQNIHS
jgi:hypothetical protein